MKSIHLIIVLFISTVFFPLAAQEKINIAISASPNNLAPFYSTDANSQNINRLIHSSLVDFNEKMQFVCIACETYEEKMESSKHVFIFKLRQNLTFSNGDKVSAKDVVQSYDYFAKNEK